VLHLRRHGDLRRRPLRLQRGAPPAAGDGGHPQRPRGRRVVTRWRDAGPGHEGGRLREPVCRRGRGRVCADPPGRAPQSAGSPVLPPRATRRADQRSGLRVRPADAAPASRRQATVAPKTCSSHTDQPCDTVADCPNGESCFGVGPVKSWVLQAAINGEWQELTGLDIVNTSDVVPQALVYDQYLPATGVVHLEAAGAAHECVDTLYGKSLGTDLAAGGFTKGLMCLNATAPPPGTP